MNIYEILSDYHTQIHENQKGNNTFSDFTYLTYTQYITSPLDCNTQNKVSEYVDSISPLSRLDELYKYIDTITAKQVPSGMLLILPPSNLFKEKIEQLVLPNTNPLITQLQILFSIQNTIKRVEKEKQLKREYQKIINQHSGLINRLNTICKRTDNISKIFLALFESLFGIICNTYTNFNKDKRFVSAVSEVIKTIQHPLVSDIFTPSNINTLSIDALCLYVYELCILCMFSLDNISFEVKDNKIIVNKNQYHHMDQYATLLQYGDTILIRLRELISQQPQHLKCANNNANTIFDSFNLILDLLEKTLSCIKMIHTLALQPHTISQDSFEKLKQLSQDLPNFYTALESIDITTTALLVSASYKTEIQAKLDIIYDKLFLTTIANTVRFK